MDNVPDRARRSERTYESSINYGFDTDGLSFRIVSRDRGDPEQRKIHFEMSIPLPNQLVNQGFSFSPAEAVEIAEFLLAQIASGRGGKRSPTIIIEEETRRG